MVNFVEYQNQLHLINAAASDHPEAFVNQTEEAYHESIRNIAESIVTQKRNCGLVMLSGPSSSGKTTTANLLKNAFQKIGVGSTIISLDDFYRGERQAPLLANGQHDYESVDALDVPEVERCLLSLIETRRCNMPVFNFEIHMPYPHKRQVTLGEHDIAIVEGIHALNPIFINKLPANDVCKIYISVKQGIHEGKTELFTANGMRLIRRIVRDYKFRGAKPERTLEMWPNVMDGERKYIKPYRGDADYTINSLHAYETCVLAKEAIPILQEVPQDCKDYDLSQKLIQNLKKFTIISSELVPNNSIIREFIGGGIY
ncbi:nucleoside kinase [Caproiciproducens galactitolivorans]|uniref:Uridine kinase n=2 Tax=Caproiciproducens galactitolivorans TaxID=642589 RepID=A0A4Z0Y5E9_9FIRM|nr:nucleoside kinase [Caproiciproducens galactitolivorans]QEY34160.1 nucleoside kinase [Caproiciproducens galactitolivorans]TGJ78087.1 uridine kinase [Caproiciproducens galactitolivorans]